jgi:hypothetical protein
MPTFRGARAVRQREQKLQSLFRLIDGQSLDAELGSHYARYFCVLIAGFAEQALKELISEHARAKASAPVHRFVELNVNKVWGINQSKLREVLDSFDLAWYEGLEGSMPQEISSLHSVGKLRDNISHGNDGGVTIETMRQYSADVFKLYRRLSELLDPGGTATAEAESRVTASGA